MSTISVEYGAKKPALIPEANVIKSRLNWPEESSSAAVAWKHAFHSQLGDCADQERITRREAIIAMLIEKNECLRQQLMG